jgi:hypothetical protein
VTPPVFDLDKLRRFREYLPTNSIRLLVSVKVLGAEEAAQAAAGQWRQVYSVPPDLVHDLAGKEPEDLLARGAEAAGRLVKKIKEEKLADGVYLKAKGRTDLFTKILEAAAL